MPLDGHGQEQQVDAVELVVVVAKHPHLQALGQRHPGQVVAVLAVVAQALRLLGGAAQQRGPHPGPLQQQRHGGAEGARARSRWRGGGHGRGSAVWVTWVRAASAAEGEIGPVTEQAAYERRFRRAGLPLFIEDYTATGDVFTRAVPLLALVFIGEVLGAIDLDWSVWANLGAAAGGLAIVLGAFAMVNLLRGRPPLAVPDDVGRIELAGFVIVPAVLPLVFGGQITSALVTAAANLVLLILILGVVGFGLVSIVRWAAGRLVGQLLASVALLVARSRCCCCSRWCCS